jgi:nitroimidazol reductase NimA-like FMN-containing flavoprotein (pyridoxamine 5'-phosphate oxidase superfamily)
MVPGRLQTEAGQVPKIELTGPWSMSEIEKHLRDAIIPVRLSAISATGWPVVVSLWFVYQDAVLWCASKRNARIVELLETNARCGFEIAGESPPYFGVRGQGLAEPNEEMGGAVLRRLADRYLGVADTPFRRWLLAREADEVAIAIRPVRLTSWDYRRRMSNAV